MNTPVLVGRWSFLVGLALSVLAGLGGVVPSLVTILFVLGIVVGFLNISERESTDFLVAVIALLVIGVAGLQLGGLTKAVVGILNNVISFVSAAGLIVAIKQVLVMAK